MEVAGQLLLRAVPHTPACLCPPPPRVLELDKLTRSGLLSSADWCQFQPCFYHSSPQVVEVDNLDETQRGAGGYGSTGIASH